MLASLQFPFLAKALSVSGIGTVVYWVWRIIKNRKIGSIRARLLNLGITQEDAVRAWMEEWREDDDLERVTKAKRLLKNETTRADIERALCGLVADAELEPGSDFLSRLSIPVNVVIRALFPFSLNSQDRETLDRCGDLILAELKRFKTIRRAGQTLICGRERITLQRLMRLRHYGEIWLAAINRNGKLATEIPPHEFRVVHFLTNVESDETRLTPDQVRDELKPIANAPGMLQAQLGTDAGVAFAVTEYLPGGSLKEWLTKAEDERVPLDKEQVMRTVIGALADAHRGGIYHRLLCPSKILLTAAFDPKHADAKGQVKLADFWLSRLTNESPDPIYVQTETRRGNVLPEAQQNAKNDVFALGVLWYQFMMDDSDMERPPYDFFDQLDDTGRSVREWIKACLAGAESRVDDAGRLQEKMDGAAKSSQSIVPGMNAALAGHFDVSDLLHDYLQATG